MYLFGVDIGGTTIKIGLIKEEDNQIIEKFVINTNRDNNGTAILPDVRDAIYEAIERNKLSKADIKGIGFGVPGPVSNDIVHKCINLGWGYVDVSKEFKALLDFDTNVSCGNDANCAALGEMYCGNDSDLSSAVMFTLGTGVGGGIIINGKPIDGFNGAGGELGHMHVDSVHNYECNCGLKGCLETVASATGVVRLAKEYLPSSNSSLKELTEITCKDVFDAAKAGDELGLKVVDELGYYIGLAASYLAIVVDPEAFIIGGGVSKAGQILIDSISKHYANFAFHSVKNTSFILASLGNDGGMLGAALLAKK